MSQPYPVPIPLPQPKSRPLPDSRGIPDTLKLRGMAKKDMSLIQFSEFGLWTGNDPNWWVIFTCLNLLLQPTQYDSKLNFFIFIRMMFFHCSSLQSLSWGGGYICHEINWKLKTFQNKESEDWDFIYKSSVDPSYSKHEVYTSLLHFEPFTFWK